MANIYLSVADGIGRFRGTTKRQFDSWLYRIATNQCNNAIRKTRRRQRILEAVSAELVQRRHNQADSAEDCLDNWPAVYAALSRLKPMEQTVITLRFFEKLDFDAISDITGKRSASVRVIHHRALKKLRHELRHLIGGAV